MTFTFPIQASSTEHIPVERSSKGTWPSSSWTVPSSQPEADAASERETRRSRRPESSGASCRGTSTSREKKAPAKTTSYHRLGDIQGCPDSDFGIVASSFGLPKARDQDRSPVASVSNSVP
uniref:Uncharacterized protein n=1 Tax=Steinernema glaseri TaxID=37863 RepID=A0A1I7YTS3_9BILA